VDWSGLFVALLDYLGGAYISAGNAGMSASGQQAYAVSLSGLLVARGEVGRAFRAGPGMGGIGLYLDLATVGLKNSDNGSGADLAGGLTFDLGPQIRYSLTPIRGVHIDPSITYAWMFTNGQSKVDGGAIILGTQASVRLASFATAVVTTHFLSRHFDAADPSITSKSTELSFQVGLAFHNLGKYGHN
jgi:hypothetical protein